MGAETRASALRALRRQTSGPARARHSLSGAEKLAIGGIGVAVAGGFLLGSRLIASAVAEPKLLTDPLGASESEKPRISIGEPIGTSDAPKMRGATEPKLLPDPLVPSEPENPIPATSEILDEPKMRRTDTTDLLGAYVRANAATKDQIAEFCVCRVHDLRDLLIHDEHNEAARQILEFHLKKIRAVANKNKCQDAQVHFLNYALTRSPADLGILRAESLGSGIYGRNWGVGRSVVPKRKSFRTLMEDVENNGNHVEYGPVSTWDVRYVESMSGAFSSGMLDTPLNDHLVVEYFEDLSFWDTRRVKDMSNMFRGMRGDVNVGRWDTSSVTSMEGMFYGASQFNGDIGAWDVGRVSNVTEMFEGATAFTGAMYHTGPRRKRTSPALFPALDFGRAYV